jgi:hypothetical protein
MWLSGFFGLAVVAHVIRLVLGFTIQIGETAVPVSWSVAIVVIAGILSAVFYKMGCGNCGCSKKECH